MHLAVTTVAAANVALAQASNTLLYGAMILYTGAFVAFAAEWASARRGADHSARPVQVPDAVTRPRPVAAFAAAGAVREAGGGVDLPASADLTAPPAPVGAAAGGATAAAPAVPSGRAARIGRVGVALTAVALVGHAASVVLRGLSVGRLPWGNMFEFSTAASLAMTLVFVGLLARGRPVRYLGVFVTGIVLLVLGLAVTVLYTQADQLVPALKSVWLGIHVTAAILSVGLFTVGFIQTVLYLARDARDRREPQARRPSWLDRLPTAEALDRAAYRVHAFVFPLWTFAIMAGAIWAENAWGRYWGWDPKEVWSFVTWVAYAAYLHARATAGWRGRKAAYLAIAGFATIIFNYFVVNIWLVGYHSYAGIG